MHESPDSSLPSCSVALPWDVSQGTAPSSLRLILTVFPSLATKIVLNRRSPSAFVHRADPGAWDGRGEGVRCVDRTVEPSRAELIPTQSPPEVTGISIA